MWTCISKSTYVTQSCKTRGHPWLYSENKTNYHLVPRDQIRTWIPRCYTEFTPWRCSPTKSLSSCTFSGCSTARDDRPSRGTGAGQPCGSLEGRLELWEALQPVNAVSPAPTSEGVGHTSSAGSQAGCLHAAAGCHCPPMHLQPAHADSYHGTPGMPCPYMLRDGCWKVCFLSC